MIAKSLAAATPPQGRAAAKSTEGVVMNEKNEAFVLPNRCVTIPPEIKHIGPSYVPFANDFSYFMDYTGQSNGFIHEGEWRKSKDYMFADIISGHAMRPAPHLEPSQSELHRIYEAVGFTPQTFYADQARGNYESEADMIKLIKHALHVLEQPAILPTSNQLWGAIVVGYKENGKVLIIYGFKPFFMDMANNAQPVVQEISDWYQDKTVLTIVGERGKIVAETEIHIEALRQIHAYLGSNINGADRHYFDEWESFLRLSKGEMITQVKRTRTVPGGEHDEIKADMDDGGAWKLICDSHSSTWCNMAERRFYIAQFLYKIMDQYPAETKGAMKNLADHYWESGKIMGGGYGGNDKVGYGVEIGDPVNPEIFEKQDVRERMADCVRIFRQADKEGLELTEKLLLHIK